ERKFVPQAVEIVTIDVSYLSLAAAVPQLERIEIAPTAELIALVKPQFELRLGRPPAGQALLEQALARAIDGIERMPWGVEASFESPVQGARGAIEFLVYAIRRTARGRVPSGRDPRA